MPKAKPIPFRPDDASDAIVTDLHTRTGMSKSEILRRACRYSLPKFVSGEVDISRITAPPAEPAPAQ